MRPHLGTTTLLAIAACTLGACSSADEFTSAAGDAVDAVADQAIDAASNVSVGSAEVCAAERKVIEIAIEAYTTLEGVLPQSEADLVARQYLAGESKLLDVDASGAIVPALGSSCT